MRIRRRKFFAVILVFMFTLSQPLTAFAADGDEPQVYSEEYMGTEYYSKLQKALEDTTGKSTMERVLAIANSQEGYKDYPMSSTTPEAAREAGYLWTGKAYSGPQSGSGNTEYTRWAQEYVMGRSGDELYLDCDWCAIFASWCMYQAGYYSEAELKKYFYSYYADPREEKTAGSWIEAFNFENENVWYTPKAAGKVEAYSWGHYTNTDIDPYQLPYQPGGLVFFSWDASGKYFSHVGIVVSYDPEEHILTYINGNVENAVTTRVMDLDEDEEYHGQIKTQNANRIMAFAKYDAYTKPGQKTITADQTEFSWKRESGESINIKTDSASKTVLLTADCGYWDSNMTWPSQLILRYGEVTIGQGILSELPDGDNKIKLDFADGSLEIKVNIYTPEIEADETTFVWNRNSGKGIEVKTNSASSSLVVYGDGFVGRSKTGEVQLESGVVTLTPRLLSNMADGKGQLTLVFGDGNLTLHITVYVTGWQKEDGRWFYYTKNGVKKTGWLTIADKRYYMDATGVRQTGWKQISGKWYYFNSNGVMTTGWKKISDKYYYFAKNGIKKTGWITLDGKRYYLDAAGVRQTGWKLINGKKYHFAANGIMATGWKKISGKNYYFGTNGVMAKSEWVSGRWIGANGVWSYKPRGSWHKNSKGKWFGDTSGWYAKNQTQKIDGKLYTFDKNGYGKGKA